MSRKRRIIALVDPDLVPPESIEGVSDEAMADWKMEFDVCATLEELGHDVFRLGLEEIEQLSEVNEEFAPHVTFNMLEEFHGSATYEPFMVGHLELLRMPYTGCNPRGLLLAHDKFLTKQLLRGAGIPTPQGIVASRGQRLPATGDLQFPLLAKSTVEDASLGITLDSIVHDRRSLERQVERIHEEQQSDALIEEFIEGREFYVGTLGNARPRALPVWELLFHRLPAATPNIATADVKWDFQLQRQIGVDTEQADLPDAASRRLRQLARKVHQTLGLSGYARMDFRMTENGQPFVLEANPNPNLSYGEDFAESAAANGISYEATLQKIINLGIAYEPAWKNCFSRLP